MIRCAAAWTDPASGSSAPPPARRNCPQGAAVCIWSRIVPAFYGRNQSSQRSCGTREKSRRLALTSSASLTGAIDAILRSMLPMRIRCRRRLVNWSAARSSNSTISQSLAQAVEELLQAGIGWELSMHIAQPMDEGQPPAKHSFYAQNAASHLLSGRLQTRIQQPTRRAAGRHEEPLVRWPVCPSAWLGGSRAVPRHRFIPPAGLDLMPRRPPWRLSQLIRGRIKGEILTLWVRRLLVVGPALDAEEEASAAVSPDREGEPASVALRARCLRVPVVALFHTSTSLRRTTSSPAGPAGEPEYHGTPSCRPGQVQRLDTHEGS